MAPGCVVDAAGTLYFVCDDQFVCAVDGVSGMARWQHRAVFGRPLANMPALSPDGSTLFVVDRFGGVAALATATGQFGWFNSIPNWFMSDRWEDVFIGGLTVGSDNTLYFLASDHVVHALDGWSGTQKWTATLGGDDFARYASPAIGDAGIAYFGFGGTVTALNATTGRQW